MPDTFTITILFIVVSTLVAAFVKRIKRDKCLYDFYKDKVTLESISDDVLAKGILDVENSALEFTYPVPMIDENGLLLSSYVLYKYEYSKIQALIRFHDELSEEGKKDREKDIEKTYHPSFGKKLLRQLANILRTIKDTLAEVVNLFISNIQKKGKAGTILKSHSKYVSQIKNELIESVGTEYEPVMEHYIGHWVVFEMIKSKGKQKYAGILKDYTQDYIELLDVDYKTIECDEFRKADLVIPQKLCIVRHLGE